MISDFVEGNLLLASNSNSIFSLLNSTIIRLYAIDLNCSHKDWFNSVLQTNLRSVFWWNLFTFAESFGGICLHLQKIFINGIHLNFGTCIEIFPSVESGTKRHQIVSFSSAHFDFVIAGQCSLVDHRAPQTSDVSIERRRHIDRFTTAFLYIFFWIFFQYVIYGS